MGLVSLLSADLKPEVSSVTEYLLNEAGFSEVSTKGPQHSE